MDLMENIYRQAQQEPQRVIFPEAENEKMQQFAHADAYGPMLQGFDRIVCDCSRGALVEEIVGNVAMSCVRAQKRR